jgi:hypothetical protein
MFLQIMRLFKIKEKGKDKNRNKIIYTVELYHVMLHLCLYSLEYFKRIYYFCCGGAS